MEPGFINTLQPPPFLSVAGLHNIDQIPGGNMGVLETDV